MLSQLLAQAWYRTQHRLRAGNAHGLHSPFVYDLYTRAIRPSRHANGPVVALPAGELERIASLRTRLTNDSTTVSVTDFGAGTGAVYDGANGLPVTYERSIKDIARSAAKSPAWGEVLARVTAFLGANTVLELGTSLGISTAYLALGQQLANKESPQLISFEGSSAVAEIAKANLYSLGHQHVKIITGNLDETLETTLQQLSDSGTGSVDLVFIDANHTEAATLHYFDTLLPYCLENTCLIFDDIHWSTGMHRAWVQIRTHAAVKQTVDLGQFGLVFFRNGVGHYHLR